MWLKKSALLKKNPDCSCGSKLQLTEAAGRRQGQAGVKKGGGGATQRLRQKHTHTPKQKEPAAGVAVASGAIASASLTRATMISAPLYVSLQGQMVTLAASDAVRKR